MQSNKSALGSHSRSIPGISKFFFRKVKTVSGIYSDIKDIYNFEPILIESDLNINDDDLTFIFFNSEKKVISLRCIFYNDEIGNAYTLKSSRKKGYSKKIAVKVNDYTKRQNKLYYIFTEYHHVKNLLLNIPNTIFHLIKSDSMDNMWNGNF